MAFDQPIEADSVDDLGFLSSLIRAPVVGVLWLLGHNSDNEDEEEDNQKQGNDQLDGEIMGDSKGLEAVGVRRGSGSVGEHADNSNGCHDRGQSPTPSQRTDRGESKGHDKENKEPASSHNWPSVGHFDPSDDNVSNSKNIQNRGDNAKNSIAVRPRTSRHPNQRDIASQSAACPATQIIDDLVAVMENSHSSNQASSGSPGPATSAVLSSQGNMSSSSLNSLSASYSASTFPNHQSSQSQSLHLGINNGSHSSSSMRGNKKMSWSDECGNRSLTVVEYFDDSEIKSKHWSAMRRNNSKSSRRNSFDESGKGAGARRGEVRVIKSALKRSGSYSPPTTLYANNSSGGTGSSSTSSSSSSTPVMKSFRSLSVIGSSESSMSNSSGHLSKESQDTNDSTAGVTKKKLNSADVQCVPSTLQVGSGRANGGLIIPRGGPSDSRYYFPRGGPNDPRYQVILGTSMPNGSEQKVETIDEQGEQSNKSEDNANEGSSHNPASERSSPSHHHQFLPRHTNGYISPQYGFYVNITPPASELYASRKTLKDGDKSSRSPMHHQSYQQFQYQSSYQAPSSIPEGQPGVTQGIHQRFVGRSSVPRPSSNRSSEERASRQSSLKPTFTNNKKGMGMLLAEHPHHGAWPSVPFG